MDTLDLFRVLGQHPLSWPILNFLGRSTKQGRYKAMSVSNLGTNICTQYRTDTTDTQLYTL